MASNVFVSYARLDDLPPTSGEKDRGFVSYLLRRIRQDLIELAAPEAPFWQDRGKIAPGDDFPDGIRKALRDAELFLAVLSRHYIQRPWCREELETMSQRILEARLGEGRIFRVDKHSLVEKDIPEQLQDIKAVPFYSKDKDDETERENEYYLNGKIRRGKEYDEAVRKLGWAIYQRLKQPGVPLQPVELRPPALEIFSKVAKDNGHVVFVAKPAGDMVGEYRLLVQDLRDHGYRVVPGLDEDFGTTDGSEVDSIVDGALAAAEASVHLLGDQRGWRPKGHNLLLAPLQLAAAGRKALKDKYFVRMIWAPEVLLQGPEQAEVQLRDPLSVFKTRFGGRLLDNDQVVGDTLSRFNEFVLQRLEPKRVSADKGRGKKADKSRFAILAT